MKPPKLRRLSWNHLRTDKKDGKWWQVYERIVLHLDLGRDGVVNVAILPGWRFDLGSVPLRLHGIVNPGTCDDDLFAAYLLHDAMYASHYVSRRCSDDWLLEAFSQAKGVDRWDRWLAWGLVRLFASGPWVKKDTEFHRSMISFEWSDK